MEVKTRVPRRKRRLRKEVKWTLTAFVVVIVLEYVVLPEVGGARKSFHQIDHINLAYVFAGVVLEAAALIAYAQLTKTVLPPDGPKRGRILQINLSSLAVSHVVPGGTAPGAALSYRLYTQEGVRGADVGFALAMQGVGSAVVLNVIFWLALFVSLFTHGYNPLYAVAAGAGVIMMGTFATVVVLLTRGRHRAVDLVRRLADRVPFLDGEQLASAVQRVAERLGFLAAQKELLRRAIAWAAANWLLDAASLWVSIAAFGKLASPIDVLVAYGLANILAVIPVTPGGLGVVEGVLVPTLAGFGVKGPLLAVLLYRLWNFWLPIPVGGAAYLSLRFSDVGWSQRLKDLRNEVVEDRAQAGQAGQGFGVGQGFGTGQVAAKPAQGAANSAQGAANSDQGDANSDQGGRTSQDEAWMGARPAGYPELPSTEPGRDATATPEGRPQKPPKPLEPPKPAPRPGAQGENSKTAHGATGPATPQPPEAFAGTEPEGEPGADPVTPAAPPPVPHVAAGRGRGRGPAGAPAR